MSCIIVWCTYTLYDLPLFQSNLAELDNEVHVDAENISTDKHSADENTRTSEHKPSMNEVRFLYIGKWQCNTVHAILLYIVVQ